MNFDGTETWADIINSYKYECREILKRKIDTYHWFLERLWGLFIEHISITFCGVHIPWHPVILQ